MKTLNIINDNKEVKTSTPIKNPLFQDEDEKYPCWYANLESGSSRKDYKWKVGYKYQDQKNEYVFNLSKVRDVDDDNAWNEIVSVDFAIDLISRFRNGGVVNVKKWIKNGCPRS